VRVNAEFFHAFGITDMNGVLFEFHHVVKTAFEIKILIESFFTLFDGLSPAAQGKKNE
jgi:phenylalanine-4-hydroxylase